MLEKTIRKYYDEIFRYCYHHVGSKTAAQDLCQDTFLSFIERYEQYRHMGKMRNYLYTIARNKCIDYYRKQTPFPMREIPEPETRQCIEETVIVRQMVLALPEEFREAIILRYFQNLRYTDIAAVCEITLSLAKYRVKKGLKLLAEMEGGSHEAKKD